jgi:hypothetical protein
MKDNSSNQGGHGNDGAPNTSIPVLKKKKIFSFVGVKPTQMTSQNGDGIAFGMHKMA